MKVSWEKAGFQQKILWEQNLRWRKYETLAVRLRLSFWIYFKLTERRPKKGKLFQISNFLSDFRKFSETLLLWNSTWVKLSGETCCVNLGKVGFWLFTGYHGNFSYDILHSWQSYVRIKDKQMNIADYDSLILCCHEICFIRWKKNWANYSVFNFSR